MKKKASREVGIFFFFLNIFSPLFVTEGETSDCHISRLVSEVPRLIIYQQKADFLINLVNGVWHNWAS